MPVRNVPGTELRYYLVAFDADGRERTDDRDGQMSQRVLQAVRDEPVTDVFLFSHGWKGDVPSAVDQYDRWTAAMARSSADRERARAVRPGFRPLLVGLHWPSLPWGEADLSGAAVAFAPAANAFQSLIDAYAERLADTPAARAALATIIGAAAENAAPPTLPPEVRAAYAELDRETGLGSKGEGAAPGDDREPFDAEAVYQATRAQGVPFGGLDLGGVLGPLRELSFWKMKDRARQFGESGGGELLAALQHATDPGVRFHLMGHSFGCIVVSAMLAGPRGRGQLVRPVHSVALVQGALSLWSYCSDIPPAAGKPGYFHSLVADRKVSGPIVVTISEYDTAVGYLYPLGAGVARQVVFAPGEYPKYGALGAWGARGPGIDLEDRAMLPADQSYGFVGGKVYNLQSGQFIREGGGPAGAHGDILKLEVAHAVWEAVLAPGA